MSATAQTVTETEVLAQEVKRQGDEIVSLRSRLSDSEAKATRMDREIDRIYHELGMRRAALRDA